MSSGSCWTCRLRRKKCDESRPSCSTCKFLELSCHGYGKKPEWMDRGILEKGQRLQIKHIIRNRKLKRRQEQLHCTHPYLGYDLGQLTVAEASLSSLPLSSLPLSTATQETTTVQGSSLHPHHVQFHPCNRILNFFDDTMLIESLYNTNLSTESFLIASSSHNFNNTTAVERGYVESNSTSFDPLKRGSASTIATAAEPKLCRYDDVLFMYYLDQVFYVQYPFYRFSDQQGRGWLFSILRRVKSAYYATLALSEYHQHSTNAQHSTVSRAKYKNYGLALQEMQLSLAECQTWSGTTDLVRSVEALTSILQLLFWDVRLLLRYCLLLYYLKC